METKQSSSVVVLSTSESWALLRDGVIGRLAVLVDDEPDIFPINYLVDHGSIVFRTANGTKLIASTAFLIL
ncbi:MAG: pyridoxamine 5'-phosphate oxidase family protein [Geodermatophilaceae bacterium]